MTKKLAEYALQKTIATGLIDMALLLANASQLRLILEYELTQTKIQNILALVLVVLSILLQVLVGFLLIYLGNAEKTICKGSENDDQTEGHHHRRVFRKTHRRRHRDTDLHHDVDQNRYDASIELDDSHPENYDSDANPWLSRDTGLNEEMYPEKSEHHSDSSTTIDYSYRKHRHLRQKHGKYSDSNSRSESGSRHGKLNKSGLSMDVGQYMKSPGNTDPFLHADSDSPMVHSDKHSIGMDDTDAGEDIVTSTTPTTGVQVTTGVKSQVERLTETECLPSPNNDASTDEKFSHSKWLSTFSVFTHKYDDMLQEEINIEDLGEDFDSLDNVDIPDGRAPSRGHQHFSLMAMDQGYTSECCTVCSAEDSLDGVEMPDGHSRIPNRYHQQSSLMAMEQGYYSTDGDATQHALRDNHSRANLIVKYCVFAVVVVNVFISAMGVDRATDSSGTIGTTLASIDINNSISQV